MKQTKIVASVSDLRCDVDFIRQLYKAGVNVIRMNTAHATPEGLRTIIRNVREVSNISEYSLIRKDQRFELRVQMHP